jgi:ABC-type Fe3+-hydroxamate transport system substrate-binding protein
VRVVSLVPSVTETLLAWGVDVVACTRFCEQPGILHVGGTKDPDIAAIVALRPDLVVVDREENRRPDADALGDAGVAVHVTHVTSVDDVVPMLGELAAAVGLAAYRASTNPSGAPVTAEATPRVAAFVAIWRRPWMTINADTYGSSLLAHIGVDNVFAGHADRYPPRPSLARPLSSCCPPSRIRSSRATSPS